MSELPELSGPMHEPASGGQAQQLVILCHGVGADGNDLIGLAPYLAKVLPEAKFIAPNAPYAFDGAPSAYNLSPGGVLFRCYLESRSVRWSTGS